MEMPSIHVCMFVNHEHERLKEKIVQLKEQITCLERNIRTNHIDHAHTCSIACQTELPIRTIRRAVSSSCQQTTNDNNELQRLVDIQTDLVNIYEVDIEENRRTLSSAMIDEYQRRFVRYANQTAQAEQRTRTAEQRLQRCQARFERMRTTTNLFDDEFFDEVNDLKCALRQTIRLNEEYEKTIDMLSTRLALN
jgi:hypothetical protein